MARRAIPVDDDEGIYDFVLGAEPISYAEVRKGAAYLKVIEPLLGWDPWQYAVETDCGVYFVDGPGAPREFGRPDDEGNDES